MGIKIVRYGLRDKKYPIREVAEFLQVGENGVEENDSRLSRLEGVKEPLFLYTVVDPLVNPKYISNQSTENNLYTAPLEDGIELISEEEYFKKAGELEKYNEEFITDLETQQAALKEEEAGKKSKLKDAFINLGIDKELLEVL